MKNILVLCTGNSCRSQMAEGYLKHYLGKRANVYSAGIETHGVNPRAIIAMAEDGIDISKHTSNNISEYAEINFDIVITVCDHAQENCPFLFTDGIRLHYNFPDPAKAMGTEIQIMAEFRLVRNMIKQYIANFSSGDLIE